jgi:DNA-binding transcriptional ArsR family regulator
MSQETLKYERFYTEIERGLYLTIMLSITREETSADLDLLFGALADATRRAIVAQLATGEATVTELAAPFSISLPAVSRHLKVLERASIISRSKRGRWRSARLSPNSLASAATWLSGNERRWQESLDRLDDHLAGLALEHSTPSDTQGGQA